MTTLKRRRVLIGMAAFTTMAAGCGSNGGDSIAPAPGSTPAPSVDPGPPTPPIPTSAWRPVVPALFAGAGAEFDLRATLPAGSLIGGVFSVDPAGSQLPAGMTLSASGILSMGTAAVGTVTGVIFSYEVA